MTTEAALRARAENACELCGATETLGVYDVPQAGDRDAGILICATCQGQIAGTQPLDAAHWRCLSDSMWNPAPAVQVTAWRLLRHLSAETWAHDLLDMLYLDDDTLAWAQAGGADSDAAESSHEHRDCHGAVLAAGDTVTLIKDLVVKGANFTAKRGTAVRGISLSPDNPQHIEGRVNGQHIVILTEFVKKSG